MADKTLKIAGQLVHHAPARSAAQTMLWDQLERLPDCIVSESIQFKTQFIMAITAEANKLPAECTARSIVTAAFNCAILRLIPGPHLGHAYLVPLNRTIRHSDEKVLECHLWTGYKGFIHLGYSCNFLAGVQAEVVLEGENPKRGQRASGPWIEHDMPFERVEEWHKVTAAYCVYQTQAGKSGVFVVPKKELLRLHKRYGNVWKTNPIEMSKKTPIRRVANQWDLSEALGDTLSLESQTEAGEAQTVLPGAEWEKGQPEKPIVWQEGDLGIPDFTSSAFKADIMAAKTDQDVDRIIELACQLWKLSDQIDQLVSCGSRRKNQFLASQSAHPQSITQELRSNTNTEHPQTPPTKALDATI